MTASTHDAAVVLLWGEDAFLLREEAVRRLGDLRVQEVDAAQWEGGELQDLATPSLFGERRGLLVTDARSLSKDALAELGVYLAAPDPASLLVICCSVAERGKPPAGLLKLVEPSGEVVRIQIQRKDLDGWVAQRAKAAAVELTGPAARALVETIGEDPGQLVASIAQLADAYAGQRVAPADVHRQFRGLGEQKTWDLCDRAFGKDLAGAVRALRSIEEGGDDPLMVLGGIAARLRDLLRVRSLPERLPPAEVARRAGLRFDWQARRYQQQARHFSIQQLVQLHERIAEADRALKSGATGDVVMPILIAAIAV